MKEVQNRATSSQARSSACHRLLRPQPHVLAAAMLLCCNSSHASGLQHFPAPDSNVPHPHSEGTCSTLTHTLGFPQQGNLSIQAARCAPMSATYTTRGIGLQEPRANTDVASSLLGAWKHLS